MNQFLTEAEINQYNKLDEVVSLYDLKKLTIIYNKILENYFK
jgi:hypothetical protein|tara:strand:+ start:476 stop:601 length:126 start_codon:yes stop_codon:yes gene_type:complete